MKEFNAALSVSPNDPQRWADEALEIPNCQYWALAHKTVALSHLDRPRETAAAARRLIAAKPEFSVAFAREKLFYLKRPEQIDLYLSGLTRAGIAPR
jgi:adenylate cyclase